MSPYRAGGIRKESSDLGLRLARFQGSLAWQQDLEGEALPF